MAYRRKVTGANRMDILRDLLVITRMDSSKYTDNRNVPSDRELFTSSALMKKGE